MAIEINGKVAEIYPDSFVYRVKNHQGVDVGEFKTCDVKDWSLPKIENPVKYNNKIESLTSHHLIQFFKSPLVLVTIIIVCVCVITVTFAFCYCLIKCKSDAGNSGGTMVNVSGGRILDVGALPNVSV